jgi:glutaminase
MPALLNANRTRIAVPMIAALLLSSCSSSPKKQDMEPEAITMSQAGAMPDREMIRAALEEAHSKFKHLEEGKNADYIPALAKVPSKLYGIALVTADGKIYSVGDVDYQFSIQSISKVFTMASVLQDQGEKKIEDTVGVDATGQVFNSITAVEQNKGKQINPLVNPGAIATTSMVMGATPEEKWAKIMNLYSTFAGRPLEVNQEVYKSESETNQRNQAIGQLMSAYEILEGDPKAATDIYTRQCSVNVNARDLATMAATLANGGVNPLTGKKAIDQKHVPSVLAVMATAGLYDDTGQWLFETGLPAKSGVGGGIIAVAPGKFGIAVFSPPLDEAGNSIRAQKAIAEISSRLHANPYSVAPKQRAMSTAALQE